MISAIGKAFEPFMFMWVVVAVAIKWLASAPFRKDVAAIRGKTGRSKLVLLRLCSKRGSNEIPLVTPSFMLFPAVLFGVVSGSAIHSIGGALLGLSLLSVIPLAAPLPSTFALD